MGTISDLSPDNTPTFEGSKYRVAWSKDDTDPDGTVFSYTGSGLLESIVLDIERKEAEVELTVDGVVVYDFCCEVLEEIEFVAGFGPVPISYYDSQKCFVFYPRYPLRFESSFSIIIRAKKAKGHVITYYVD